MTTIARPAPSRTQPPEGRMWGRALSYWLANYRRVWRGTVISGFLSPLFYLIALGFGLGALVDAGVGGVGAVSYAAFVAPGILAATAMQAAMSETTYPVLGAVKWQRQYHAMLAAPLGVADIVLGHLVFVAMRVAMSTAAFILVAAVLGAMTGWTVLLAWPAAVLAGLAFAAPVMAFAVRQDTDVGFTILFRFVQMPMFLFSGVFFPVEQLPDPLELLARVTPLWHAVDLLRGLVGETATAAAALGHLGYLLLWVAAGLWLALRSYRARLIT